MMSKRYLISKILDSAFLFDILARYAPEQHLIIVNYHRVRDKEEDFPFDEGVVSVTPEGFERHLRFIKKYFSVITLEELYQHCTLGLELPRNPVMITFDDGYKDNYYNAFKILQKYDLKATFFISTGYIENRDIFWWDKIAYIVKSSNREIIKLSYPYEKGYRMPEARTMAIKEMLGIVKTTYNLDLSLFIDELASSAKVDLERSHDIGDEMLLTWSDIKEMKAAGMDIGSHTEMHRVLSTLPEAELEEELSGSRCVLEHHLGEPVYALSYPVGGESSFNQKVQEFAKRCGYALGFSYIAGVNLLGKVDPFDVKRLGADDIPFPYFKAIMTVPQLIGCGGSGGKRTTIR
jgi:peptidoglycan/xylan/chitin deacetylase (PgdA/CDA1 family)